MKQQKKEPITRKMIEKEINYAAKAELGYIAYPIIVTVVLLVPLLLLAIFGFRNVPWLFIPYLAVISLCILLCGYSVYKSIYKYRVLKKMDYSVVIDEVSKLSPDELSGKHTTDYIYFAEHGKYAGSTSQFALSSVGDTFYLLIVELKNNKNILVAYPTSLYEYKE